MTTAEPSHQQRTSPNTDPKERLLPALQQDLSGYTPQRHFRKLQGRVFQPRGVKSSRLQSWRYEVVEECASITPDAEAVENVEAADDAPALDLPPNAEVHGDGEKETRIALPVRNAALETKTVTPIVPEKTVQAAEETPRQPTKVVYRNGRKSVPRSALNVPQARNVAGTAASWRTIPAQESTTEAPPPLSAPVFPKPKPKPPIVKTYKTKVRSTLPEQSQLSKVDGHVEEQDAGSVPRGQNKQSKTDYDLEPSTSSFHYPDDSSPLVESQENSSLEDYLRDGRRATQGSQNTEAPEAEVVQSAEQSCRRVEKRQHEEQEEVDDKEEEEEDDQDDNQDKVRGGDQNKEQGEDHTSENGDVQKQTLEE